MIRYIFGDGIVGLVLSPLFENTYFVGKDVIVEFSHAEGLHFRDGDKGYFEVAGENGKFEKVKAKVVKNEVRLDASKIINPQKVRFAWSNTATPLLFNSAGLPASCFGEQAIKKEM